MAGSTDNPIYTVYLVDGTKKYNITPAVTEIELSHQDKQLAQSASVTVVNIKTSSGKTICQIATVRKRIFIYANTGGKTQEVFRGWIWTTYHKTDIDSNPVTLKCYDNLIYLQESEDSLYFSKGKKTKAVMQSICSKWGIKLSYSYSSITHGKLVLRGTLSNIITADILNKTKKKSGKKYVIYSQKDVMYIKPTGSNTTIYQIEKKDNAVEVRNEKTMDGMITKVRILGEAKKNKKVPVKATVKGDTKKYGTLQKLQDMGSDSLATAKTKAQNTIKASGSPKNEYIVIAPDIPWIKKGDKVYVNAGHIEKKTMIVLGIERTISNKKKTMTLTLQNVPAPSKPGSKSNTSGTNAQKLVAKMKELAWAYGTAKKKYDYKTGAPKKVCKTAMKKYKWADSKAELSDCGNFVSTVVRESGVSKSFKALHGVKTPFPTKEDKFTIVLKGKKIPEGFLKPGDIIRYKKKNGKQHAMFYFGDGKICEASHHNRFGVILKDNGKYNDVSKTKTIQVLRAKE